MSRRSSQGGPWARHILAASLPLLGMVPLRVAAAPVTAAPGWAPRLTSSVRPLRAHVGDPLTVTVVARCPRGVAVNLPLKLELGEFVELGRSESSREPAAGTGVVLREQTFRLRVAAYKLGTLTLPALSLTALGPGGELLTLQTKPTTVRIGSVLGNEPDPRLKPLDPPVVVYRRSWWLLYTLGALLAAGVVAAASVLAYRRWQARRAARPAAPPVPAHEQALARLAALPVASWLAQQRHKELYAALSEILRAYLGARWGFEALEMTTSEVATALVLRLVPATQRDRAQVLCQACDLVKFAKLQPDDDEARQAFAEVEAIVREMAASAELALQPSVAPATAEEGS